MKEDSVSNHLFNDDIDKCYQHLDKALSGGNDLVAFLDELLYTAASIKNFENNEIHPLITMNCIKNIIGDNRLKPSEQLLSYSLQMFKGKKFNNYNKIIKKTELKEDVSSSIFVGNFEDAIQACDWKIVDELMPMIYFVSDRSRSIIDTIADLGFQNIDSNALMIFHLLRAFNFTNDKLRVWTYACCLINQIKNNSIPKPSSRKECAPEDFLYYITFEDDIKKLIKYAAVSRVWNGDYVRLRSYKREISSWLCENFSKASINDNNQKKIQNDNIQIDFISVAEKIISKSNSYCNISKKIIALDALRYLMNIRANINIKTHVNTLLR